MCPKTYKFFQLFKVQHALENEDDNDENESGSGGFGDDEDDIRKPMRNEKTHLNKPDQTSNVHHSGDGSDLKVDSESTGDDDEDYTENHEDHTPLHTDDIYFANTTDTEKPFSPTTTTDDEDSQLFYPHFIILLLSLLLIFN